MRAADLRPLERAGNFQHEDSDGGHRHKREVVHKGPHDGQALAGLVVGQCEIAAHSSLASFQPPKRTAKSTGIANQMGTVLNM
jgi:hypothetical protein